MCKLVVLTGGIWTFMCVPSSLTIFTARKIIADPGGFSAAAVSSGQSLYWIGWALASTVMMPRLDGLGRKVPCYTLLAIAALAAMGGACAKSAWFYGAMNFVVGFTMPASSQCGYLLIQESLPERLHAFVTVLLSCSFSLALALMALSCKWVTQSWNWRLETMMWYAPLLVLVGLGSALVSEPSSSSLAADDTDLSSEKESTDAGLGVLFGPALLQTTVLSCISWVGVSVGYYALSYCAGSLSSDLYLNVVLFALVDVLGFTLTTPLVEKMGARRAQMLGFAGSSLALLLCAVLPSVSHNATSAVVMLALLSRLCFCVSFTTVFLLLIECFSEKYRAAALGVTNASSRLLTFSAVMLAYVPPASSRLAISAMSAVAAAATWKLKVA